MHRSRLRLGIVVLILAGLWLVLPSWSYLAVVALIVVAAVVWALATRNLGTDLVRRVDPASVDLSDAHELWRARWTEMLSHMEPSDELWEFCTRPGSWENLRGRAGYVVVRNGLPTKYSIVTRMN